MHFAHRNKRSGLKLLQRPWHLERDHHDQLVGTTVGKGNDSDLERATEICGRSGHHLGPRLVSATDEETRGRAQCLKPWKTPAHHENCSHAQFSEGFSMIFGIDTYATIAHETAKMCTDELARATEAVFARHMECGRGSSNKLERQVECNHCLGGSGSWHDMAADNCLRRRIFERPLRPTSSCGSWNKIRLLATTWGLFLAVIRLGRVSCRRRDALSVASGMTGGSRARIQSCIHVTMLLS